MAAHIRILPATLPPCLHRGDDDGDDDNDDDDDDADDVDDDGVDDDDNDYDDGLPPGSTITILAINDAGPSLIMMMATMTMMILMMSRCFKIV